MVCHLSPIYQSDVLFSMKQETTSLDFDQLFPTLNNVEATGKIRSFPKDFKVTEVNPIELSNQGEHLWLYIEKTNSNTDWVAKQLSNICQVPRRQVSFAGLKDRNAITKQWFSIQLPQVQDHDKIQAALPDKIFIIKAQQHSKKIKIGQLDCNQFEITIRDIEGDKKLIEQNISRVKESGVPNYFGPQRFGHQMGNIQKATDWFAGKYKPKTKNLKSLLISTARSHIFNSIVAQRIKNHTWDKTITGDILQLNGSHSWFNSSDATADEISSRLSEYDIHLTGAMWGENTVQSQDQCAQLENQVADTFNTYQEGLNKFRLKQDRRAMRIAVTDLQHEWNSNDQLVVKFRLPAGCYATSVIREIIQAHNAH